MDMTQFAGRGYIGLDDVADGTSFRSTIEAVELGSYNKPVIVFTSGRKFSVNVTNAKTLVEAWGAESESWIGETIEFYKGVVAFKGEDQPSVLVRPIVRKAGEKPPPKPRSSGDAMDKEIPF